MRDSRDSRGLGAVLSLIQSAQAGPYLLRQPGFCGICGRGGFDRPPSRPTSSCDLFRATRLNARSIVAYTREMSTNAECDGQRDAVTVEDASLQ